LRHGDTEKTEKERANVAGISPTEIPWSKFPQPFLETFQEKEEMEQHTKPLLPLLIFLQGNVAGFFIPVLRN
jgi:hypothetical protein